eukprot:CAMPEP_0184426908 /NCGR_PEP_ID=MMETSP0738-20130409/166732_1 /TAXON_ID=385413 /ORGANISM="Thalassiosira miniscula, Strain CCMP1093" /LENGTH=41 /DNA_ID= /DNA_START= /DNA_END= /DNA_ORIENTATION=
MPRGKSMEETHDFKPASASGALDAQNPSMIRPLEESSARSE